MTAQTGKITYEEVKETGFLETLIHSRKVSIPGAVIFACAVLAIAMGVFHIYVAAFGTPEGRSFRAVHLGGVLLIALAIRPLFRQSISDPLRGPDTRTTALRVFGFGVDLSFAAFIIFVQIWTLYDINAFHSRSGMLYPADTYIGLAQILLLLEITRRVVGMAIVLIAGFFVAHALYAPFFPGFFYGPPVRLPRVIDALFMGNEGMYGLPLHVSATYIVLFIIFGTLLARSGAGRFFIDLSIALTGHRVGGPAKAAVVASGLMGTISGSAVANVTTTGAFTIPLMRKIGYRPKFAASIEACASSGGQITPPLMGAAAFLMAEFLQISYVTIMLAALIPALLYFATVYFMVHLEAEKHGIEKIEKDRLPQIVEVLKDGWHFLLVLAALVTFLLIGYTPMKAAFWGIVSIIVLSFVNPNSRMSAIDLLGALESGVKAAVPVSIACAAAGLIVGAVFVSGLGLKFTNEVINLSGGNLIVLLILTALCSIILGMGITTTAVYITVAALIVPALVRAGIEPISAHMFAFYFGVVSTITPPVALASFAAAAIANTPPMATAVESSRLGLAKYLVPFAFVFNPSILLVGPLWLSALSTAVVLAGFWLLSVGVEGWFKGRLNALTRLLVLAASMPLILFPPHTQTFGLTGLVWHGLSLVAAAVILLPNYKAAASAAATRVQ